MIDELNYAMAAEKKLRASRWLDNFFVAAAEQTNGGMFLDEDFDLDDGEYEFESESNEQIESPVENNPFIKDDWDEFDIPEDLVTEEYPMEDPNFKKYLEVFNGNKILSKYWFDKHEGNFSLINFGKNT